MARRIIICSDGTWNEPDRENPTNVIKMARAIAPTDSKGVDQIVFYDAGVGTGNLMDRVTGGAFGGGLEKNIQDGYRFLVHNFENGDEIFLFGFSRGAYTVRSLAGLIRNSGVLRKTEGDQFKKAFSLYKDENVNPKSETAKNFRDKYSQATDIKFIGVWDTVGALGIPGEGLKRFTNKRHQFHDVKLSGSVKHAYQALAIDEKRKPYAPSVWEAKQKDGQVVEQVWFTGSHSNVGGGTESHDLSNITFLWMKQKAMDCGLALREDYVDKIFEPESPKPCGKLQDSAAGWMRVAGVRIRKLGQEETEAVHPAPVKRHKDASPPYAPTNLVTYLQKPDHRVAEDFLWPEPEADDEP